MSSYIIVPYKSIIDVQLREPSDLLVIDSSVVNGCYDHKFQHNMILQSNLVISNSLILNYRLSRSENLVPVLTCNYDNR